MLLHHHPGLLRGGGAVAIVELFVVPSDVGPLVGGKRIALLLQQMGFVASQVDAAGTDELLRYAGVQQKTSRGGFQISAGYLPP